MLDFNNTEIAFARKSDSELQNAYILYNVIKRPWLVKTGKWACKVAKADRYPIG